MSPDQSPLPFWNASPHSPQIVGVVFGWLAVVLVAQILLVVLPLGVTQWIGLVGVATVAAAVTIAVLISRDASKPDVPVPAWIYLAVLLAPPVGASLYLKTIADGAGEIHSDGADTEPGEP